MFLINGEGPLIKINYQPFMKTKEFVSSFRHSYRTVQDRQTLVCYYFYSVFIQTINKNQPLYV